jgi:hypothetical protein
MSTSSDSRFPLSGFGEHALAGAGTFDPQQPIQPRGEHEPYVSPNIGAQPGEPIFTEGGDGTFDEGDETEDRERRAGKQVPAEETLADSYRPGENDDNRLITLDAKAPLGASLGSLDLLNLLRPCARRRGSLSFWCYLSVSGTAT